MSRPNQICALCDEYSVKQAAPEFAELGMGRCLARHESGVLSIHVSWDAPFCVSFRQDRANIVARQQYIQVQKINQRETRP